MSDIITTDTGGIVGLMHGDGSADIAMPFERDIFLFDTHVAGSSHIEGMEQLEPTLSEGDRLTFFREPGNPHDEHAIVILNAGDVKIGYVPQSDNEIFARLMDAGKLLFGRISGKKWRGSWLQIFIKVYLHE